MSAIDFKKIRKAMIALDWGWITKLDSAATIPSMKQLKKLAIELMKEVWSDIIFTNEDYCSNSAGGFKADCFRIDGVLVLHLSFCVDSHELSYYDVL